jgi:hypothetical protein
MSILDDDILGRKISTFDWQGLKAGAADEAHILAIGFTPALMAAIEEADVRLASLFGDGDAVVASLFDPRSIRPSLPVPLLRFMHYYGQESSPANNRSFHLFTDDRGSKITKHVFAPAGWIGGDPDVHLDGAGNTFVAFNYRVTVGTATKTLQLTFFHALVRNAAGVSLEPVDTDDDVPPRFPNGTTTAKFVFPKDATGARITNGLGSIAFGEIGGPGGFSTDPQHPYVHCHLKAKLSGVPRNPLESQVNAFVGMFP